MYLLFFKLTQIIKFSFYLLYKSQSEFFNNYKDKSRELKIMFYQEKSNRCFSEANVSTMTSSSVIEIFQEYIKDRLSI